MIDRRALALALAVTGVSTAPAEAQTLGLGGRVGTLGLGPEAAFSLTERIVVRGGMGVTPVEPSLSVNVIGIDFAFEKVELPTWYNLGIDLYLNGAMRLGGGFLFKEDDFRLTAVSQTSYAISSQTFTSQEIGKLIIVLDSKDRVPYALLGFGKHTTAGIGLFVDFGVAFLGAPDILLTTEGGTLPNDTGALRTALDDEAAGAGDVSSRYLEYWPILSLGLRIGVG
ncbi:MAG: hypothetical protein FJ207_01970 [Gemmatimonadetes bacterium]|nr:hypothetical protein [Gemmatimonadota bacterium]